MMPSPPPPTRLEDDAACVENYVLIVDDNPAFRQVLSHALKSDGFKCVETPTADQALSQIRHSRPRLIILDLILSRASGSELLRTLESDITTASIAIIAMSATASSIIRPEALALDAQIVLSKNRFSMMEFRRLVRRIMALPRQESPA